MYVCIYIYIYRLVDIFYLKDLNKKLTKFCQTTNTMNYICFFETAIS